MCHKKRGNRCDNYLDTRRKRRRFNKILDRYRSEMAVDGIPFENSWYTWDSFSDEGFPVLLMQMIEAVVAGSCSHPKRFLPLHVVKYSDGTVMLSLTGIFCTAAEREKVLNHFHAHFPFYLDNNRVDEIDVPVLTTKERLSLDKFLPTSDFDKQTCFKELGYLIEGDGSDAASAKKMNHYEKYYRLYPYFGKLLP
jgi:hypothetical protein